MVQVTEEQLRDDLSTYIDEMLRGKEILVFRGGSPIAILKAEPPQARRQPGNAEGLYESPEVIE